MSSDYAGFTASSSSLPIIPMLAALGSYESARDFYTMLEVKYRDLRKVSISVRLLMAFWFNTLALLRSIWKLGSYSLKTVSNQPLSEWP
jgi:hypothetical protein